MFWELLAFLPVFFWIGWFYRWNLFKRTSLRLLIWLFLAGLGSGLLALNLNHIIEKFTLFWPGSTEGPGFWIGSEHLTLYQLGFWIMIGFNEEFSKLLAILLLGYTSKDFQEPFDGLLYCVTATLGFASIENLFYLNQYGSWSLVTRNLITVPAHIFMSMPMGFGVAMSRFTLNTTLPRQRLMPVSVSWVLGGWLVSVVFHTFYNILLSVGQTELAYVHVFAMVSVTLVLGKYALMQTRHAPRSLSPKSVNIQFNQVRKNS